MCNSLTQKRLFEPLLFAQVRCDTLKLSCRIHFALMANQTRHSWPAQRAEYATILIQAALANERIRSFIADPALPYTEQSERTNPTVRIDYDQAFAIAGIGEGIYATRNKTWGDGPFILPLQPDDPVNPYRILYVYKEGSIYNRRFEQRRRLKELLGRRHRSLVEAAKYKRTTKTMFLASITGEQVSAIRRILGIDAGTFWRACRGREFLNLSPRQIQLDLPFCDE